jgi:hypothetical protein
MILPSWTSGIMLVDLDTGLENFSLRLAGQRHTPDARFALSADGRRLAAVAHVSDGGKSEIASAAWDLKTGRPLATFFRAESTADGRTDHGKVALTSDGSQMVVGIARLRNNPSEQTLELTAIELAIGSTGAKATYLLGQFGTGLATLVALADGADARTVLVPGYNGKVGVWDVPSGQMARTLDVAVRPADSALLRCSPDGRLVAAAVGSKLTVLEWATGGVRFAWDLPGPAQSLAVIPDGTTLAVSMSDTTILLYDLTGAALPRPWKQSPGDPAKLWDKLATATAADGWAAIRELAARPSVAVPLVKEKIKPAAAKSHPTPAEIAKLITDLDAPAFATREEAGKRLRELGLAVEPEVRKALRETTSAEVRQRLEKIAEGLTRPPAVNLAEVRAVEVLERIGTGEAKAYLVVLAGGDPAAALTRDAKAAAGRIQGK